MSPSTTFNVAARASETGETPIALLTIDHETFTQPIRVSSDQVDTVSRGNTFLAYPFAFQLPDDKPGEISQVQIQIGNVDKQLISNLRSVQDDQVSLLLELVLSGHPDLVEGGPFGFSLLDVRYNALTISGTFGYEDFLNTVLPAHDITPANVPGTFA